MSTQDSNGVRSFRDFLESVRTARFADFAGLPGVAVASADEFEAMKQYPAALRSRRVPAYVHDNSQRNLRLHPD
jgi:hypothetical protein